MYSLKNVINDIANGKEFAICFGDFLDSFYNSNTKIKQSAIQDEPNRHIEISSYIYAYVASSAHKLANDYNLEVPQWVFDKFYFLEEPYFAMDAKGRLRLLLMYESPAEFKFRNVFEVANTLSRV